ncbi:MAG: DUF3299 domain-containing protein [Bacteroidota bacterium]
MRKLLLSISLLSFLTLPSLRAQTKIDWQTLAGVTFSYIHNFEQNMWYGQPSYSEDIKALNGQEIIIKGYVLPTDIESNTYILSANPFSSCFFCGGAGQESVMELRLKKKKAKFELDEVRTFAGKLRLNDQEMELNYILEEARVISE